MRFMFKLGGRNMNKKRKTWSWRTAPRSIPVLLSWLPYFYKKEDRKWNERILSHTGDRYVYPLRRELWWEYYKDQENQKIQSLLNAGINFQQFLKGKQVKKRDVESIVRQQFTTAEQYGFLTTKDDYLKFTDVGRKVVEENFTGEDFLIQLLKKYVITKGETEGVFPLEVVIKVLAECEYLNRYETTYLFGVINNQSYQKAIDAVKEFRREYNSHSQKQNKKEMEKILKKYWAKYFEDIEFPNSWNDYSDALFRALSFTEIFSASGRSYATKIRVNKVSSTKFMMLLKEYEFNPPQKNGELVVSEEKMDWYGSVGNVILPWDNYIDRNRLVEEKLQIYRDKVENDELLSNDEFYYDTANPNLSEVKEKYEAFILEFTEISKKRDINALKSYERLLDRKLLNYHIRLFEKRTSKQSEEREKILKRFSLIKENQDSAALWLEVNTWKSLVAIQGDHKVIPNFKMEYDLTPRSFAPGIGQTPDMELYYRDTVLIPEVSLMTGVRQWEHEGSSVIEHVLYKMEEYQKKEVYGIFISSSLNNRTIWQFFILNKESWLGEPIKVVPLTIDEFVKVIEKMYKEELEVSQLIELIKDISIAGQKLSSYNEWIAKKTEIIQEWKKG